MICISVLKYERTVAGRGDSQCVSVVESCVSIVSTVEARDDGATVEMRSMRRRVVAMCAPHHSHARLGPVAEVRGDHIDRKPKPQFLVVLDCLGASRATGLTLTIKE